MVWRITTRTRPGACRWTAPAVHNGNVNSSTNGHAPAQDPTDQRRADQGYDGDTVPAGWRWTFPRALGVVAFLAMAVFWIWAFANRDSIAHPDTFDDPVFTEAAETVCAARQAAIAELPLATTVVDPEERSRLLDQGTEQLVLMIEDLRLLTPPTDPIGAAGVDQWLDDYGLYIQDRRTYADVLATGDDPPFLISGNDQGVRVTDMLGTFAEVNEMASCAPSGDV